MSRLPSLNALRAFEASGRHLTFRGAADELGVTQGAVAQHVRALERSLEATLFHRRARRGVHRRGQAILCFGASRVRHFGRSDVRDQTAGSLRHRLTTPSFAARWLVPRMGQFSHENQEIRVRIEATERLANFQSDGVDIAIRQGRPPFGPGLVSTPLLSSELIVVCHPNLAHGERPISEPGDLLHHVLLEDSHGYWPIFLRKALDTTPLPRFRSMTFSQTALAIEAAISEQGVVLTNRAFVETELDSGLLCQPLHSTVALGEEYFIVSPRMPRNPSAVDNFRRWLTELQRQTSA